MMRAPAGRPRPRVVGQPRAGLRQLRRGAGAAHGARGGRDRRASPSRPTCAIARDRRNLAVRGFERLHPRPTTSSSGSRSDIPLSGGLGTSAAAYVAGLLAADHLFELDADLLALRHRARGPPRQRRGRAARRLRDLRRRAARRASTRPPASRRVLVVPHEAVRTKEARAALPAEVPMADAVFNVAHGALLTLGLARGDLGPRRARPGRRAPPAAPRAPLPALGGARASAPASSARSARRSPAPGPTVLVWCTYEQTGAVVEALRAEAEGWADVLRAPFETPRGGRRARCERHPLRRGRRRSRSTDRGWIDDRALAGMRAMQRAHRALGRAQAAAATPPGRSSPGSRVPWIARRSPPPQPWGRFGWRPVSARMQQP